MRVLYTWMYIHVATVCSCLLHNTKHMQYVNVTQWNASNSFYNKKIGKGSLNWISLLLIIEFYLDFAANPLF